MAKIDITKRDMIQKLESGETLIDVILSLNRDGHSWEEIRKVILEIKGAPAVKKSLPKKDDKTALRKTIMALIFAGVTAKCVMQLLPDLGYDKPSVRRGINEIGLRPDKEITSLAKDYQIDYAGAKNRTMSKKVVYSHGKPMSAESALILILITVFLLLGVSIIGIASNMPFTSFVGLLLYIPLIWFVSRDAISFVFESPREGEYRFQLPPHPLPLLIIFMLALSIPIAAVLLYYYASEEL
ncbi:MAG: hypothetical protein JXB14_07790, partial [Candidatus Altiarchaeota archaeon]|nr:hypothetical protein [Candidatus Altiarchaeota archaeon]